MLLVSRFRAHLISTTITTAAAAAAAAAAADAAADAAATVNTTTTTTNTIAVVTIALFPSLISLPPRRWRRTRIPCEFTSDVYCRRYCV